MPITGEGTQISGGWSNGLLQSNSRERAAGNSTRWPENPDTAAQKELEAKGHLLYPSLCIVSRTATKTGVKMAVTTRGHYLGSGRRELPGLEICYNLTREVVTNGCRHIE